MKKIKFLALLISCALLLTVFTGCGTKDYGTLLVNGKETDEIKLDWEFFETIASSYIIQLENYGMDAATLRSMLSSVEDKETGKTGSDVAKEICLEKFKEYYVTLLFAKQYNIGLSAKEKQSLADEKASLIEQMGGRAAFVESLERDGTTEEIYDFMMEYEILYDKLFTSLFALGGKFEIPRDHVISYTTENYVRVVHILIQAQKNSADYADKTAYANQILDRVNAGEDFMTLVSELSEDPGSQSQPDGYLFDANGYTMDGSQMISEFVDASWALEVGQHSGLVESEYGYHIIMRLPLDEEYITANYRDIYPFFAANEYKAAFDEFAANIEIKTNDSFKKLDMASFIVEETTTEEAQVPELQQ